MFEATNNDLTISKESGIISEVLEILVNFSNFPEKMTSISQINPIHHFKLANAISRGEKVQFVLPAFPAKSGNKEKIFSSLPDLGEVESLKRLNSLASKIKDLYSPGVEFIVCSDGRVFSDLVGITEEDVSNYREEIKLIAEKFNLVHLSFFDLEDLYPKRKTFDQMRCSLERDFAQSIDKVKNNIKNVESSGTLFNGIHRFIKEDYLILRRDLSKNQINKMTKEISYKVIQRSNAWSALVEKEFPDAFRLSIHPQDFSSEKFPIKLLPCKESWGTPWHRVPVFKDGELVLMKSKEVMSLGGILKKYLNQYIYFELAESL